MDKIQISTQWYFDLTPEMRKELNKKYNLGDEVNSDQIEKIWIAEHYDEVEEGINILKKEYDEFYKEQSSGFGIVFLMGVCALIYFLLEYIYELIT